MTVEARHRPGIPGTSAAATSAAATSAATGIAWDPLTSARVRAVVLNNSTDPDRKTTMLLFWPGHRVPWAAAKLPSTEPSRLAVRREAGFLLDLHDRFSGAVLRTIPRRLTAFEAGLPPGAMLVEALDGEPMWIGYCRPGRLRSAAAVDRDFACVARWLSELHAATAQQHAAVRLGHDALARVAERFAGDATARRVCGRIAAAARDLDAMQTVKTVVHGDFWLGNVLVDRGIVSGVVDWESAEIVGDPLRDIARFALTYALYLDRGTRPGRRVPGHAFVAAEWGAGVRYLLCGTGWFPSIARNFVADSMARLGADPGLWRHLLLLGLAEVAAGADNDEWAYRHVELLDRLPAVC